MEDSIFGYILYGLITGFSEFVPVSTLAHQYLFSYFFGFHSDTAFIRLMVYIGCLAAVVLSCGKRLIHIRRELKVASLPKQRRKRMPDMVAVLDARLVLTGCIPMAIGLALSQISMKTFGSLLIMLPMLILSGIAAYLPQYFAGGNKDSRSMSPRDGVLLGLMSAISVIPGISRVGGLLSTGRIRGCSREYMLELCYLFSAAMIVGWILVQIVCLILGGVAVTGWILLAGILAAAAAFAGGVAAIYLMRFLAVNLGFSGFAYYCWGLAVFCFAYYLIT